MRPAPLLIGLALLAGAACYRGPNDIGPKNAPGITRNSQAAPCADTAYLRLKRLPLDSLSDMEFAAFRQRETACLDAEAARRRPGRTD